MATSGSVDYNRTRNEIIDGALRLIGKSGRGKTPAAADIDDADEALNILVKHLQASGVHLWKVKEATLFIIKGTAEYSFPGAHCTLSYVETDVKVVASSGASTIDVDSITGMTTGDFIGIALDDGTLQWTTINGAPAGDTVTLTDVLTDDVSVDATVFVYTTKIGRPLRVIDARRKDAQDVPIDVTSREEYFALPNKTSTGKVNQVYYDPQLTTGLFYIWQTGSVVDDKLGLDLMLPLEDFDSSNDDPDFPQEWLKPLKWLLASDLGYEYGIDLTRQARIDSRAEKFLKETEDFDAEGASVYFQVDTQ